MIDNGIRFCIGIIAGSLFMIMIATVSIAASSSACPKPHEMLG